MAARITPARGSKPDKLMRDALIIELRTEAEDAHGVATKKLRLLARKLIDLGLAGDLAAIREISDRVDGKATQPIAGDAAAPVRHVFEWKSGASSSTTSPEPSSSPSTSAPSASPASSLIDEPARP